MYSMRALTAAVVYSRYLVPLGLVLHFVPIVRRRHHIYLSTNAVVLRLAGFVASPLRSCRHTLC